MKGNKKAEELFKDASSLYEEALKELERGKIRDAAEKAWGATAVATNALILARTGRELEGAKETTKELHKLAGEDRGKGETLCKWTASVSPRIRARFDPQSIDFL